MPSPTETWQRVTGAIKVEEGGVRSLAVNIGAGYVDGTNECFLLDGVTLNRAP